MAEARGEWLRSELGVEPGQSLLTRLGELQGRLVEEALRPRSVRPQGDAHPAPQDRAARLSQELEHAQDRLREARHRLRNQLQSVVSTLSSQQAGEQSAQTRKALQSCLARVTAIATVNDLLTSEEVETAPLPDTLARLARQIVAQMGAEGRVRVRCEGEGPSLEGGKAAVVAMITAELVANAVEHGFWGERRGTITVRLGQGKRRLTLEVGDDGCGFPPGFDPARARSLGWQLISRMVTRDLKGVVSVTHGIGARVRVEFPVEEGAG